MVRAVRNQGRPGIASYAISAVDVALWDLKARLLDLPLHRLLGAAREPVPIYGRGGFTSYNPPQMRDPLHSRVEDMGGDQVKVKNGQNRGSVDADVAAGEYGCDIHYFRRMCAAGAVDCLQADATRCGGISGWLQAAVVADSFGLEISGHCAPAVHAHVAAAVPNLRHLEWFHDHVRVEQMLFDGAPHATGSATRPARDRPGLGLELRTQDAEPFRVA